MDKMIEREYGTVDFDEYFELDDEGEDIPDSMYIKIDNLYVAPAFRGRGKARELMDAAIETIHRQWPGVAVKVVACPKEEGVDQAKLAAFYDEYPVEVLCF